jgi:hypothetical protein
LPEQSKSAELIAAIEDRRTLEKLGGGKNSLFSVTHTPATDSRHLDSMMKKLQNMGMDEQLEEKLIAFKSLLGRMDRFRKS